MADRTNQGDYVELPSRRIPVPKSISAEARKALAALTSHAAPYPDLGDIEGWRKHVKDFDDAFDAYWTIQPEHLRFKGRLEHGELGGVPVVRAFPEGREFAERRVVFDIHGGALIYLGGRHVAQFAGRTASRTRADIVSVDYRMPPDHPYPVPLDDCVSAYKALVHEVGSANIVVCGASAGGNLAAALILRARDEGIPLPAGVILLTPELDLTESGDTFETLMGLDRMQLHMPANLLYANGVPLDDPYVSPLFGDFDRFPPTMLQSGTRDLFLSNTVRMHRALRNAGIAAELHVWEAMPHGAFGDSPEDEDVDREMRRFLSACWA